MFKRHTTPQGWRNVTAMLFATSLAACGGRTVSPGADTSDGTPSSTNSTGNAGTFGIRGSSVYTPDPCSIYQTVVKQAVADATAAWRGHGSTGTGGFPAGLSFLRVRSTCLSLA